MPYALSRRSEPPRDSVFTARRKFTRIHSAFPSLSTWETSTSRRVATPRVPPAAFPWCPVILKVADCSLLPQFSSGPKRNAEPSADEGKHDRVVSSCLAPGRTEATLQRNRETRKPSTERAVSRLLHTGHLATIRRVCPNFSPSTSASLRSYIPVCPLSTFFGARCKRAVIARFEILSSEQCSNAPLCSARNRAPDFKAARVRAHVCEDVCGTNGGDGGGLITLPRT